MHIAIDIDGTLTAYPKTFLELMQTLAPSHCITILTGSTVSSDTLERFKQLDSIGIPKNAFTSLVVVFDSTVDGVARKKGEYCRDNKVDMIFEDTPLYLQAVKRLSPSTCCWLVFK